MTLQEIFDKVSKHLLTQNAKSFGYREGPRTEGCMYRDHEGRKCAVGCLIKDEHYYPGLEGRLLYRPTVLAVLIASGIPELEAFYSLHEQLLTALQTVHDKKDVCDWPKELRRVAEAYILTGEDPFTTNQGDA